MQTVSTGLTRRSAASDLGLHCLSMSLLWDAKLKWVNATPYKRHDVVWRKYGVV